ncbi:AraC family transcriptional regulator [Caballeronia sp. 15711]|uniref:AraC family transcriptional regulator n=1 Tax=Caballeronia sp. 15711 TaxID=3391029 RepID=UPI0039E30DDA
MDPLSEALALLKPQTYVLHALDAGGSWAIRFPAHEGVKLDAVLKGSCWLLSDGESAPYRLVEGDCFLLTSGRSFVLASDPSIPPVNYLDALSYDAQGIARCQTGADCFLVAGHFSLAGSGIDRLFEYLPAVVPVSAASSEASVLRWSLDPQLSAAINATHKDIRHRWTVMDMAGIAGMSRSGFAAKFRQAVGTTPLDYVTRWRMQIAVDRLTNRETSLARIADEVGYESEASFSTVFKKIHGCSPRAYRIRVSTEKPA